jgi:DNA polymerase sigma
MANKPQRAPNGSENDASVRHSGQELKPPSTSAPAAQSRREEIIGSIKQKAVQIGHALTRKRKKKIPKLQRKTPVRSLNTVSNSNSGNQFEALEINETEDPENLVSGHGVDGDKDEDGFIAFDDEDGFSDVAESIHTAFQAFEEEINGEVDDEQDELDYVPVPVPGEEESRKRKRHAQDDDSSGHKKKIAATTEFPWVKVYPKSKYAYVGDWLTMEIKDFVAYMSPSEAEIKARNAAVQDIRQVVKQLWPDAEANVFGSFATDLYLPGSDIDMVVLSKDGKYNSKAHLYQLSAKLRSSKIGTQFEVLAKTRVPIIKFVEVKSKIRVDISFERENGVRAVQTIRQWAKELPALRYLAIVIKQFLARRHLNEVHTGGLGGYAVICLIVSFMKNHPRIATNTIDPISNLGVLLIEFFELYGKNFNYDALALCMTGAMPYLRKRDHRDLDGRNPFSIAIQDPADATNNISRGSFNLRAIKKAFAGAFDGLSARCYEMEREPYKNRVGQSILGHVIKFRGPERDFNDYTDLVVNEAQLPLPSELSSGADEEGRSADVYFELSDSDSHVSPPPQQPNYENHDDESDHDGNIMKVPNENGEHVSIEGASDGESRTAATSIDKEKKRQYWASKSGAIA